MNLTGFLRLLTIPRMVFIILFLVLLATRGVTDPDYFWHLATGEYILKHGEIPRTDIFSFTNPGKPWVAHEWLFQVFLYQIHEGFGDWGVKVMSALLPTLAVYLTYRAARLAQPTGWMPLILAMPLLILMAPVSTPRPQLFSFVFFALYLLILVRIKYGSTSLRTLLWMPPLMALWVNLHGGYVVGFALVGVFGATEALQAWHRGWQTEDTHRLKAFGLVMLGILLFSALNPDHVYHWRYPFDVMSMEAVRSMITEWASPDFHELINKLFLLLVIGFFAMAAWRRYRPDLTELALPGFFIIASLVSIRHQPFASMTLLPFMARAWGDLPAVHLWQSRKGKEIGAGMEGMLNLTLLVIAVIAIAISAPVYQQSSIVVDRRERHAPFGAVDFIEQHGLQGRIFSTYHYGGYLIHRLYPAQRVFIDGRADMYGDDFLEEHSRIYAGKVGWEPAFDRWNIDMVLTDLNAPIRQLLLVRGDFVSVYEDRFNGLLVQRSLAEAHHLRY